MFAFVFAPNLRNSLSTRYVIRITLLTTLVCVCVCVSRFRFLDDLYAKARNYLLRYFIEVAAKNKDILEMGLKDFYDIISDDELNTREEDHVWKLCIKWIDYDPENRKQYVAQLMQGVRLGLMTPKVCHTYIHMYLHAKINLGNLFR